MFCVILKDIISYIKRKAAQINVQQVLNKILNPLSGHQVVTRHHNIPPLSEHCIENQVDAVSNKWTEVNIREMEKNWDCAHFVDASVVLNPDT